MKTFTAIIKVPAETSWGHTLPEVIARVELSVDVDALLQSLGRKAIRSKGKRTAALAGKIKVKVIK